MVTFIIISKKHFLIFRSEGKSALSSSSIGATNTTNVQTEKDKKKSSNVNANAANAGRAKDKKKENHAVIFQPMETSDEEAQTVDAIGELNKTLFFISSSNYLLFVCANTLIIELSCKFVLIKCIIVKHLFKLPVDYHRSYCIFYLFSHVKLINGSLMGNFNPLSLIIKFC